MKFKKENFQDALNYMKSKGVAEDVAKTYLDKTWYGRPFTIISDLAIDEVAERLVKASEKYSHETVIFAAKNRGRGAFETSWTPGMSLDQFEARLQVEPSPIPQDDPD